jgi:hypothetical protein
MIRDMDSSDLPIVSRAPLADLAEAYSAAVLERVELADGRRLVLKHLPADGDWLTRVSGGTDRVRRIWRSGLLGRLGRVVDHTVIDVVRIDGHEAVVMRDATAELLSPRGHVPRQTSRELLAGIAALHDASRTEPVLPLCPIGARYGMFAPATHAADDAPGAHPARHIIVEGWERFVDQVATDVAAAVFAVHRDPDALGRRLARFPTTVVHGDVKLENLGLARGRLVAIDWGDLTGFGPPEIDVAWYALMNTWRIGGSPGDAFADYEAASGRPLAREALDLACVGSLAQMGFKLARNATVAPDPATRHSAAEQLAWWTARVRTALDRTVL